MPKRKISYSYGTSDNYENITVEINPGTKYSDSVKVPVRQAFEFAVKLLKSSHDIIEMKKRERN